MLVLLSNIIRHTDKRIYLIVKHLLIILFFTFCYYLADRTFRDELTEKKEPFSLMDSFYFSLVTQTTVGYGSVRPTHKLTKYINILQLMSIYGVLVFDFYKI